MKGGKQIRKYNQSAIRAVKDIIDTTPLKYRTIDALAEKVNITRDMLDNGFKELYGEPIGQNWRKMIILTACAMLDEGSLSIAEVAFRCHYTPNSFSRRFREEKKMTPMQWQNRKK